MVLSSAIYEATELSNYSIEELMEDANIVGNGEANLLEMGAEAIADIEYNYNSILRAVAVSELACLEESGQELVLEGDGLKGFFEKVKEFFRNIWKKIQEIFKSAVIYFDRFAKTDKDFYNKYKKDIQATLNTKGGAVAKVEVPFYPFAKIYAGESSFADAVRSVVDCCNQYDNKQNLANYSQIHDDAKGEIDDEIKKYTEEYIRDEKESINGDVVKVFNSSAPDHIADSEFRKELAKAISGEKDDKKLADAANIVINSFVTQSDKIKKTLNDQIKAAKSSINAAIKNVEALERKAGTASSDKETGEAAGKYQQLIGKVLSCMKNSRSVLLASNTVMLSELKKASSQAKGVLAKVLSLRNKKEVNENAFSESTESVIGGIVFPTLR